MLDLIWELSRALRCCQQEAVFCEDITFTQFVILDSVVQMGGLSLSRLHGILSVDKSTTTRLVSPLVEKGFILRERSSRDFRAVNLQVTRAGEAVHKKVWACLSNFMDEVETRICGERRQEVFEAVRSFLNAIRIPNATVQSLP